MHDEDLDPGEMRAFLTAAGDQLIAGVTEPEAIRHARTVMEAAVAYAAFLAAKGVPRDSVPGMVTGGVVTALVAALEADVL